MPGYSKNGTIKDLIKYKKARVNITVRYAKTVYTMVE